MQILTLRLSVADPRLDLQKESYMKGRMRHLVLLHTLLLIQVDGLLVMLDYLGAVIIQYTQNLCLINSVTL